LSRVEALHRSVDVAGQAEDLGVVDFRQLRDSLDESSRIAALSNLYDSAKGLLASQDVVCEDLLHVRA